MTFNQLPSQEVIQKTIEALRNHGFNPIFVENKEEAKQKVLSLIPKGSEVFTASSITAEQVGLTEILNHSGDYDSVRVKLNTMDHKTQGKQMRELGTTPDYILGSVHAITTDGQVLIASRSGSQIPGYVYGAKHVVWVAGAQKIVKDIATGTQRIFEYILPLEGERANKAYNITSGSKVDKLLTFYQEETPGRINLILVNETLGF